MYLLCICLYLANKVLLLLLHVYAL